MRGLGQHPSDSANTGDPAHGVLGSSEERGPPFPPEVQRLVDECWPRAQAHWSRFLLLGAPLDGSGEDRMRSVAQIDLTTRQVHLHSGELVEKDLLDCLEAILAHEVGHHVRYPGSLAVSARMRLLEKPLLPLPDYSFANLFTDLLINQHLAALSPSLCEQLARVYRAYMKGEPGGRDPAFVFYLAVYEELWGLPRGDLMGEALGAFEAAHPAYRADAQLMAQDLFFLGPNLYTQFLYFVSVLSRYLQPSQGEHPESLDPYRCSRRDPSADDWADALRPGAREREAVARALEKGWITQQQAETMVGDEGMEQRIHSLPGSGTSDATLVPEVMAAWYRREAERYLFRPPPQPLVGEAVVPTTLESWEIGDPVQSIDWLATLVERGAALAASAPLRRERIADYEGHDVPLWQPRVELYLDVSGSMPDPRRTLNVMALAAQILVVAAIRAGGWVRAAMYSSATVQYWTFCRSEMEMSRFLMHYIGGGTNFPFPLLASSLAECATSQPLRVILTDGDFHANYEASKAAPRILADAAERSPNLIFLLHGTKNRQSARYEAAGAQVLAVEDLADFPRMAAGLAQVLFPNGAKGGSPSK